MQRLARRRILASALASCFPLRGQAQHPSRRMAHIGCLTARSLGFEGRWLMAFQHGLRNLGYIEGDNIIIEQRHAPGR
jgi:hypothetical protein